MAEVWPRREPFDHASAGDNDAAAFWAQLGESDGRGREAHFELVREGRHDLQTGLLHVHALRPERLWHQQPGCEGVGLPLRARVVNLANLRLLAERYLVLGLV